MAPPRTPLAHHPCPVAPRLPCPQCAPTAARSGCCRGLCPPRSQSSCWSLCTGAWGMTWMCCTSPASQARGVGEGGRAGAAAGAAAGGDWTCRYGARPTATAPPCPSPMLSLLCIAGILFMSNVSTAYGRQAYPRVLGSGVVVVVVMCVGREGRVGGSGRWRWCSAKCATNVALPLLAVAQPMQHGHHAHSCHGAGGVPAGALRRPLPAPRLPGGCQGRELAAVHSCGSSCSCGWMAQWLAAPPNASHAFLPET